MSCCRRMNHAALPCGLPFASPSPPCLVSSLVHLPASPLLHPCLNLLKRRCGLTVVISHHAVAVLCVISAQYASDRSREGRYESRRLRGADKDRSSCDLPILSCFILVHSRVCARVHPCVRGIVHHVTSTS